MLSRSMIFAAAIALSVTPVLAQGAPGMGPVAQFCNDDMAKLCPGQEHGNRAVRTCLEQNKAKLSDACKKALDSTGPGQGMGGMGGMGGQR